MAYRSPICGAQRCRARTVVFMTKRLGNYVQDLRINRDFMDELRFGRLIEKYGGDGFLAVMLLWRWAAVNQPTLGCLGEMTEQDILRVSMIGTKRQEFVCDLLNWEFIRRDETGRYSLTNWVDEQPYVSQAEERSQMAREKAKKRGGAQRNNKKDQSPQCSGNAPALQRECSNTNSNAFKSPPAPQAGGRGKPL